MSTASVGSAFRSDIQGMRAVAVLLVLGYHAGVPGFSGGYVGVDVFFVISGFLITGLLVREVESTGTVRLGEFWARRARRLLPASALVLVATGLMTAAVMPVTRWADVAGDLGASAGYVVNWRFVVRSVDYLAAEAAASPVQHFWSLAVEEQFYLVWPVMLFCLAPFARGRSDIRRAGFIAIAAVTGISFAWSVHLISSAPEQAFFASTARVWELGIGALLAIVAPRLRRIPVGVGRMLGGIGLLGIAVAAVAFDESTGIPGVVALVPTLGAAGLLVAGLVEREGPLQRALDHRWLQTTGDMSYSLYLWHWPMLVAAGWVWGGSSRVLTVLPALLVVAVSWIPAWAAYRFVERPIHRSVVLARRPRRALAVGIVCTAMGIVSAVVLLAAIPRSSGASASPPTTDADPVGSTVVGVDESPDREPLIGAEALVAAIAAGEPLPIASTTADLVQAVSEVVTDVPKIAGESCIAGLRSERLVVCEYGGATAAVTVAVVGDSKAHQWLPGLQVVADRQGWRLITMLKSGCALITVPHSWDGREFEQCRRYNEQRAAALLEASDLDVVIVSHRMTSAFVPGEADEVARQMLVDDLARIWGDLTERGVSVVVLLDNPSTGQEIPDCVALNEDEVSRCAFPFSEADARSGAPPQRDAARIAGVPVIDMSPWICPGDICPPVIGDVLVYRTGSHLSALYVRTLAPMLEEALLEALRAR